MIDISEWLFSVEDDELRLALRPYFSDWNVLFLVLMRVGVGIVMVWRLICVKILLAHSIISSYCSETIILYSNSYRCSITHSNKPI